MTDYTDGSSFIGVDDTACAADQPLDTWLDHRFWSNSATIAKGLDSTTATFYSSGTSRLDTSTGHRPYCAVGGWQSIVCFDLWCEPGLTGLKLAVDYNVQSEGATQNDMEGRLTLDGVGAKEITLTNTDNAGSPSFEDHTTTWTFDRPYQDRAGWKRFVFEVRSLVGDSSAYDTVDLSSSQFGARDYYVTAADGDMPPVTTGPASGSLEVKYLVDAEGRTVELVAVDPNASGAEKVYTWPIGDLNVTGGTVSIWDANYIQVRSISVQLTYEPAAIVKTERARIAAKTAVGGYESAKHINAIDALHKRPRLLAFGPTGTMHTTDEYWPDDYPQLWTYAQGDGNNQTDHIIDEGVRLDGENPTVIARMYMVCTYYDGHLTANLNYQNTGLIDWDLTLTVAQMQDGDSTWAGASYSQNYNEIQQLPCVGVSRDARVLQTIAILHDYGNRGSSTPENYAWAYREGSLLGNDYTYIVPVQIELPLTSFTSIQTNAARVTVDAALDSVVELPWSSSPSAAYRTARIRATCVGWSLWSRQDG